MPKLGEAGEWDRGLWERHEPAAPSSPRLTPTCRPGGRPPPPPRVASALPLSPSLLLPPATRRAGRASRPRPPTKAPPLQPCQPSTRRSGRLARGRRRSRRGQASGHQRARGTAGRGEDGEGGGQSCATSGHTPRGSGKLDEPPSQDAREPQEAAAKLSR
ncbi:hypothetical protein AALO_G00145990 [Alosa alosa]|uniref:Uncharacterized protein n=1 Tax=Alosa alosa TaxID=278164 RepID=A0AAV6GMW5_9TELE|nr:hypothetical protein AALO_G00145990 [Alosa alosa]